MKTNWRTPTDLFDTLNVAANGFRVDAAADYDNRKCEVWYGPGSPYGEDALQVPLWGSPAFCNPPYDDLEAWTRKFVEQQGLGVSIISIIPAFVGTRWFYDNVVRHASALYFLVGRIPFVDPEATKKSQNRHDSVVAIYTPTDPLTPRNFAVNWWDWKAKGDE